MQKSRLGISVGLLGAMVYFAGLINGLLLITILAGYILLAEDNEWLRRTSVKAVVLCVVFSFASIVVGFIPEAINVIDSFVSIFGGSFSIPFISSLVNFVNDTIVFIKNILFVILGLKALNQGTIVISVIDKMINKYMQ